MHVAVTGVSGHIGSAIARKLKEQGHTVTGLVRATSQRDHIATVVDRFVVGDQGETSVFDELLDGTDAVIHNSVDWSPLKKEAFDYDNHIQSNLVGSLALLNAAAPRQFIYISSVAVHHDMRPRWDGQIDEDHPLRPASLYGALKAAVEAHCWAAWFGRNQPTCAFRPCAVYGMDPTLSRTIGYPIVESLKSGEPYSRPGGGKFVHVDDVAAAVVASIGNEAAYGRAYNLVDCYARWSDWANLIADELNIEDAVIDDSSPAQPKNQFLNDAVASLGVTPNRGHTGIKQAVSELVRSMM